MSTEAAVSPRRLPHGVTFSSSFTLDPVLIYSKLRFARRMGRLRFPCSPSTVAQIRRRQSGIKPTEFRETTSTFFFVDSTSLRSADRFLRQHVSTSLFEIVSLSEMSLDRVDRRKISPMKQLRSFCGLSSPWL